MKIPISIVTVLILIGCHSNGKRKVTQNDSPERVSKSEIKEPAKQEQDTTKTDMVYKEYLGKRLAPIRKNYNRINAIYKWTVIDTIQLNESTEGGSATYYYLNETLLKIIATHYGESGKVIQEFYTKNGVLSFVLEKRYDYNRPLGWDDNSRQENNDNAVFDAEKFTLTEDQSFFEKGMLIRQISDLSCGASFAQYYLDAEQKQLKSMFNKFFNKANN